MADHTTYRVFCREPEPCEGIPRLDRQRAEQAAREHADELGHRCEVVKVQFTSMGYVTPREQVFADAAPSAPVGDR